MSIKKRIYWSFFILVLLFVANGIASLVTLNNNRKLSENVSSIINPSLESLEDFEDLLVTSKMYTTNWVFLRSSQDDKAALLRLHKINYPGLKAKLILLSARWDDQYMADSLTKIFNGIEQLFVFEKRIMSSLQKFEDYENPVAKLESEMLIEDELLPRTSSLINELSGIVSYEVNVRNQKNKDLEKSSVQLRMLISVLAITIILTGIFLSLYMARVIVSPINKISHIVNDLGKGIIRKVNHKIGNDEIGGMIGAVNNLSEKLQATASFAAEIGNRNFNSFFKPLSNEDTLGKALIAMRDNIKSSDEKLNQAQHIAHLGSLERDLATGDVFLSDEMFNILDIDPATFDYDFQNIVKLIQPEYLDAFKQYREKHLKGQQPDDFECKIVTPKGITKSVIVQSKVVLDSYGKPGRIVGIIQDISDRKKVEEQIKLSNERYELVTKTTNDMIWDWDLVNNIIFRNENYSKVFGTDAGDRNDIGKWIKNVHPDDKEWVVKYIQQKQDDPDAESWEVEFRYYRYNNEMVYLYDRGYIIRDKNKKAIRMVGATTDVTERKKAEIQLRKSEDRYRQIVETAQEGIWLIDENNNTTFVNKKMCDITEYSSEEVMGKKIHDFMDEEANRNAAQQIESRKNGISETHDSKFITKRGKTVWASLSTNPVFDDAGIYRGALAMVTDITQRKYDEELLQKSQVSLAINNHELEQKNKELEQFAYVASHDMQEPLRTASSFVELLQQQYFGKLDSKADQYLTYILQASDRMQVLIKDLLDYSRIGSKKELKQVNCNTVLYEVMQDLGTAIQETGAEIKADVLPVISGYQTEIKQLFQNLVFNAIKFRKKNISPVIHISVQRIEGYWQFSFTDNGIGIAKKHSERIFIIFQRLHTRNEYQGSGIGLSHCKKIVELHKGMIWLESELGKGTTFYFTIPQNNN